MACAVPLEVRVHRVDAAALRLPLGDPLLHASPQHRHHLGFAASPTLQFQRILDQVVELDFRFEVKVRLRRDDELLLRSESRKGSKAMTGSIELSPRSRRISASVCTPGAIPP